jgi:carbamoyltransferase
MNILGITGLGVGPAACLVQNGRLIAMAEEERFNRFKGSLGLLPEKATQFCLNYGNLYLDDIDYIVFPWDTSKYRFYMPYFCLYTYLQQSPKIQSDRLISTIAELLKYQPSNVKNAIVSMLRRAGIKGKIPPIKFIPHHLAHAASAFYCSGFDQAHILIIDGSGEDKCTAIFKGEDLEIEEIKCFKIPNSLGWFYQSVTEFLGFLPNRHEGKTMALASYGKYNQEIYSKFEKIISFNKKGGYKYDAEYSFLGQHLRGTVYSEKMVNLFKNPRYYLEPIEQIHKDIAFAAQDILEKIVISIVKEISSFSDYNGKLCIAGGVGLNCKMNGVIASQNYIKDIFIPPTSNDTGTALGAALYFSKKNGFDPKFKMEHAYWGPEFSNKQIEILLNKLNIKYKKDEEIEVTTAKLLAEDKIVGWFQGRMEIGPRALGARSILANPTKDWIKNKVNNLKSRELWRPFAPSLLYETRYEFLLRPQESPFMTLAFEVAQEIKEKIPSVVHLDNSTRPHLVKKDGNPKYWKLINEFKKISGVSAILNTSFNMQGEPIVCTPEDALKTFYATELDYLAMGDFLVYK